MRVRWNDHLVLKREARRDHEAVGERRDDVDTHAVLKYFEASQLGECMRVRAKRLPKMEREDGGAAPGAS